MVVVVRVPALQPAGGRSILDLYVVAPVPARCSCSAFWRLLGIFYISTFIDLADKLFRGVGDDGDCCCSYFYFQTPQFVYYIIPMSALVATLVTIGVLTKNSELLVMRACGISLYRTAVPLLLFAVARQRRAVRAAGAGARRANRKRTG